MNKYTSENTSSPWYIFEIISGLFLATNPQVTYLGEPN